MHALLSLPVDFEVVILLVILELILVGLVADCELATIVGLEAEVTCGDLELIGMVADFELPVAIDILEVGITSDDLELIGMVVDFTLTAVSVGLEVAFVAITGFEATLTFDFGDREAFAGSVVDFEVASP